MSKHTPGKWITRKGLTAGREVVSPDVAKSKQVIARCGGPDRDENSNLIAAAPDLLEALEACACFADINGIVNGIDIRSALKKARGK